MSGLWKAAWVASWSIGSENLMVIFVLFKRPCWLFVGLVLTMVGFVVSGTLLMVRLKLAVWVLLPAVPLTVITLSLTGLAVAATVSVSTEASLLLGGLKLGVTPPGRLLTSKLTASVKLPVLLTVMLIVPLLPFSMLMLPLSRVKLKSPVARGVDGPPHAVRAKTNAANTNIPILFTGKPPFDFWF